MASKSKKGRNPAAVDNWLDSIGLYRKNTAYDETCLFRAASEQLFECQIYHERVRKECIKYGRENYFDFWDILENEEEWYHHLDLLEKHMVICGNVEIQLISYKYNCDVVVYDAARQKIINVTTRDLDKTLTLCRMSEDHYDVVHKREHIENAGICQSLVYGILYEKVFQIDNVQDIVRGMLYDKEFVAGSYVEINNNLEDKLKEDGNKNSDDTPQVPLNIAPFPFKVAKALDPSIYRNIEYDAWTEVRRELRLGDWYYGDDKLILGTRCIFNDNNQTYECYIQEIIKNENKCVVYVTKLAEKRTVNYTDLSPENDAKPWPLPYRFNKNLVVTPQHSVPDKNMKLPKKRKDKRIIKSNSESQTLVQSDQTDQDIEAFIGVPLQMQNNSAQTCPQQEAPPENSLSQHNLLVTPDVSSPMPKFSWDAPWPNGTSPGSSDKYVWSQPCGASPNMGNFNMKQPMVASAPVTPSVIPYHDSQYPFVFNYHVDNYNSYNGWQNDSLEYSPQESQYPEQEDSKDRVESYQAMANQMYNETYEAQPVKERLLLTLPVPNSQPVEVFSPVIPIPPGTPVIYGPPPEVPDLGMPPPPFQVYTPPVDVQYVSPTPYFYSSPIPTTWYPLGINSQGFIFPAPVNQNLQTN